jgi:hypothetical protein
MGGLISRSACHTATARGLAWPKQLTALVCLGTPHHGAPLERAGKWVDTILGVSPYSAPLARLGKARSAGIQDLRYGNLLDEHWQGASTARAHARGRFVPLPNPKQTACYFVAATKQEKSGTLGALGALGALSKSGDAGTPARLRGDGLVPVESALGVHKNAAFSLQLPAAQQLICYSTDHFQLLSSPQVYAQLQVWLKDI